MSPAPPSPRPRPGLRGSSATAASNGPGAMETLEIWASLGCFGCRGVLGWLGRRQWAGRRRPAIVGPDSRPQWRPHLPSESRTPPRPQWPHAVNRRPVWAGPWIQRTSLNTVNGVENKFVSQPCKPAADPGQALSESRDLGSVRRPGPDPGRARYRVPRPAGRGAPLRGVDRPVGPACRPPGACRWRAITARATTPATIEGCGLADTRSGRPHPRRPPPAAPTAGSLCKTS